MCRSWPISRGVPSPSRALALDPRARQSLPTPAAHPAPGLTGQHHHVRTTGSKITETPDLAPEPSRAPVRASPPTADDQASEFIVKDGG